MPRIFWSSIRNSFWIQLGRDSFRLLRTTLPLILSLSKDEGRRSAFLSPFETPFSTAPQDEEKEAYSLNQ